MPFDTLPNEIIITIFDYFYNSINTLGTICLVSNEWRICAHYTHLWQLLLNGRKTRKDARFFGVSLIGHLRYDVPLLTPLDKWYSFNLKEVQKIPPIWNDPLLSIIFNADINTQQVIMYIKKFVKYIRYENLRNLSTSWWFIAACAGGRPELAQFFMEKNSLITPQFIVSQNNLVLRFSAAYDQFKTMRWLYESGFITREHVYKTTHAVIPVNPTYPVTPVNQAYGNLIMKSASRHGNVELAVWGQSIFNFQKEEGISTAIIDSCANGHLAMVEWLWSNFTFTKIESVKNDREAIIAAAANGQLKILQWLLNNCHLTESNKKQLALNILCQACRSGHLSTAQWIHHSWGYCITQLDFINKNLLIRCCESGHLTVVEWLIEVFGITKDQIIGYENRSFIASCSNGHLSLCQLLHAKYNFTPQEAMLLHNRALLRACDYNKYYVIQWLVSTFHLTVENNIQLFSDLLFRACHNGNLITAQWLAELSDYKYYNKNTIKKSLIYARKGKRENIIGWLKERFVENRGG